MTDEEFYGSPASAITEACPHGREHRCGVSSRGNWYSGEFCKGGKCEPIWNETCEHDNETLRENVHLKAEVELWRNRAKRMASEAHSPSEVVSLHRKITSLKGQLTKAQNALVKERAESARWRSAVLNSESAKVHTFTPQSSVPDGAIYDDKVAKLLNLAIGSSSDDEARASFEKARSLHAKAA